MENLTLKDVSKTLISEMVSNAIKSGNKDFRSIYDSLPESKIMKAPKSAFIDRIAAVTLKSTKTVRCWLAGVQKPDALSRSMIEKELNVSADELFPEEA